MNITNIKLKNFKFHTDLEIPLNNNCLIYGENGTGKSSIYWALHTVFKKEQTLDVEKFKKLESDDDFNVTITMDNQESLNNNETGIVPSDNFNTIFFINQDLLETIIDYNDNFYIILKEQLNKYFPSMEEYINQFDNVNKMISEDLIGDIESNKLRKKNISEFKRTLNKIIDNANDIIKNSFQENDIQLSFDYDWNIIKKDEGLYDTPVILLNINSKKELKLHFNEAKLKLTSMAIFFALIKLEEQDSNYFKLLVLDDFLTSLDMANRKLIIQFVLDKFIDYQKIILTHNLQFYNIIIKLLKIYNNKTWDIKNIYLINNDEKSTISTKNQDYLKLARDELDIYNLEVSGNYLRKEFERINTEFEQLLSIGRVEELDLIIQHIKSSDLLLPNPNKIIKDLYSIHINIKDNTGMQSEDKYKQLLGEIEKSTSNLKYKTFKTNILKDIIRESEFYKNILMNYASHDDTAKELYKKEFKNTIKLLSKLGKLLNDLN